MLTLKEKIEMLEGRISRANLHWSFLFTINLAIIGWALTEKESLVGVNLSAFYIILVLFYIFIFMAILRAQSEMILLEKDIVSELQDAKEKSHYINYLSKTRFKYFKIITWPVYWSGNIAVIYFLVCQSRA